ncbi:MAG: L,D-transpeptidase [Anaerolineae bacterium]|nr:L,D-transpeptidase [Anaerolineae bacterium]
MLQKRKRIFLGLLLMAALLLDSSIVFAQDEAQPTAQPDAALPADHSGAAPETGTAESVQTATMETPTPAATTTPTVEPTPTLPAYQESYEGLPLCLPGVYLIAPVDCLPMGPSETLTKWAREGISIPDQPLIASHPDRSLLVLNKNYAKLNVGEGVQAAWYPDMASAISGWGASHYVPIGNTLYISYDKIGYNGGDAYVTNALGEWIRASPTVYSDFQGLLFAQQPKNDFGWIIDLVNPRREPSYNAAILNEQLTRNTVVKIYDTVEAEGTTWYMIGIGKWVERRAIRAVYPHSDAPEGVENGRWIEVNLYEQTLCVYENNQLLFATLVATGYEPYYTQPGLFQIRLKKDFETMTGAFASGKTDYYLLEDVPWTMYYDGPRALHGAYWRAMFGYEQSHGCINLSVGDSAWLYQWANEGDWVYVWDPSGETPTDPSFYTVNAAF